MVQAMMMLVTAPLVAPLIRWRGLKTVMIAATVFTALSAAISCIPVDQHLSFVYVAVISQTLVCMAIPICRQVRAKIAAIWFPQNQWTLSLSIMMTATPFGVSLAQIIPATVISDTGTKTQIEAWYSYTCYTLLACSLASVIAVIGFFAKQPRVAPTRTSTSARTLNLRVIWMKLRTFRFGAFVVTTGVMCTTYLTWMSALYPLLRRLGVGQATCGIFNAVTCLAAVGFQVAISYVADRVPGSLKGITIMCTSTAFLNSVWLLLLDQQVIGRVGPSALIPVFFLITSTRVPFPILTQLLIETLYPVDESVVALIFSYTVATFFLVASSAATAFGMGSWVFSCTTAATGLAALLSWLLPDKYVKSEEEQLLRSERSQEEQPLLGSGSLQSVEGSMVDRTSESCFSEPELKHVTFAFASTHIDSA